MPCPASLLFPAWTCYTLTVGYWPTDKEGHSFSVNKGEDLTWGDSPADELDSCLKEVYDILGRVPSHPEMIALFNQARQAQPASQAARHLKDGLGDAAASFASDLKREPSPAELRAGFLFSVSSLASSRELFNERHSAPGVGSL